MAELSEAELIALIAHALHHSGPPSNAERIDINFAMARASVVVRELVDRVRGCCSPAARRLAARPRRRNRPRDEAPAFAPPPSRPGML